MSNFFQPAVIAALVAVSGCALTSDPVGSSSAPIGPKPPVSALSVSVVGATKTTITVQVCAGSTGAPAGFTLHWLESSLLVSSAWPSDTTDGFCEASFSGNASESRFDLAPSACETVVVGALATEAGESSSCNDPLECGTEYAFRAFAHGTSTLKRSDWSSTIHASTADCYEGCTVTQGFWKTHPLSWPVSSLSLGTITYTDGQLLDIFGTPVKGNGLVSLAHQLAAAKLNIAAGASGTSIASTITAADAMIGSRVVPSIGIDSLAPSTTTALTTALTSYNEGVTGPGHCTDSTTWSTPLSPAMPSLSTGKPMTSVVH